MPRRIKPYETLAKKLVWKEADPNYNTGNPKYRVAKDRGRGYYYRRAPGWFSKYHEERDAEQYHRRRKINPKNVPRAEELIPHLGDYKTAGKGRKTPRKSGGRIKGYF
jgi:hypothetical protein